MYYKIVTFININSNFLKFQVKILHIHYVIEFYIDKKLDDEIKLVYFYYRSKKILDQIEQAANYQPIQPRSFFRFYICKRWRRMCKFFCIFTSVIIFVLIFDYLLFINLGMSLRQ